MFRSFFVLLLLISTFKSYAQDDEALQRLSQKLSNISSIVATFVQYSVDQKGSRMQESKGELKASRDGRIYWHTFEPLEQVVSSDGKLVTVYDPDLEQATIQPVSDQLSQTPAILFSGDVNDIDEHYTVEHQIFNEFDQYTLKPKQAEGLFDKLKVRFIKGNIKELSIIDALGQQSTMSFIQTQINSSIDADSFVINMPEGTDIIRDIPTVQ